MEGCGDWRRVVGIIFIVVWWWWWGKNVCTIILAQALGRLYT